ncbi:MAG TPA: hypothetical protein VMF87_07970 [Streptosporangiaceae bacterium]|nr:hypothetical protein [Streptosporangiaceae bacterium]
MIYRTALLQLLDWLVPPAPPAPFAQLADHLTARIVGKGAAR